MQRALSIIGQKYFAGYICCVTVCSPAIISEIGSILMNYQTPQDVTELINLGDLQYIEADIRKCAPITPNNPLVKRVSVQEFKELRVYHPYAYLFDNTVRSWEFHYTPSKIYRHPEHIPLRLALELNKKNELFTFDFLNEEKD